MCRGHDPRSAGWSLVAATRRLLPGVLVVLVVACGAGPVTEGGGSSAGSSTGGAGGAGVAASSDPAPADLAPETDTPVSGSDPATSRGRVGLPDPALTPGATNPEVTPADLATTICRSGWSKSVRPPVSYTGTLKRTQISEYGYQDRDPRHYQEDHLIPLSIGGAPKDPANLWPEPLAATLPDGTEVGAETKDRFELYLHAAVCDGSIPLRTAQRQMAGDWIAGWEAAGRP